MMIVIDLSKKLIGYNLFENFIYQLNNDGILVFANNPLIIDDDKLDYDKIRLNIYNLLYNHHASSFSLCILNNMNAQKDNPIINSISSNIYNIKEKIIKPLLSDYSFLKLYYLNLDDVKRDYDGNIYDDNIKIAVDLDSLGYINNKYDNEYMDLVVSLSEIENIDNIWNNIKNKNDINEINNNISNEINILFDKKINLIKDKYKTLSWYSKRLNKVRNDILNNNILYKNINNQEILPSLYIKNSLKSLISTYYDIDTTIIHINLCDKNSTLNKEVLKYRHQLEIIGTIIYLATNDTKIIFDGGKTIDRENHYEINTILNDKNLAKMLKSYNSKLKIELDKLKKYKNNEIEYEEYNPRKFNFSIDTEIPKLKQIPSYSIFSNNKDYINLDNHLESLYKRYLLGIEYTNKRVRDLTIKLRLQKESVILGKVKKWNILEINAVLNEMKNKVLELQEKIAFYRPKETIGITNNLKLEYEDKLIKIKDLMSKRINFTTFIRNSILIIIVSLCMYLIIKEVNLPKNIVSSISILMLIIPQLIYIIIQIIYLNKIRNLINKKINILTKENEKLVNELFSEDNETAMYIQDIYNLIMMKKYINNCNKKLISSNKKFKQYNYHYDKLKEHIATNDKLIDILNINSILVDVSEIDKIDNLNIDKLVNNNPLYCSLNYLLLIDDIKNKVIINNEQIIDIDNKLIGFIDKFIISYDKEYRHD